MEHAWLDDLLDRLLSRQDSIIGKVPFDLRWEGRGRKGRLVVHGNPGCVRYFRWTGHRLVEDKSPTDVRNTIEMDVDTLLDLAMNNIGVREAVAAGLIRVTGDRSLYDREEMMVLITNFVENQLRAEFR